MLTWLQIAEDQIERMRNLPPDSKVELLQNSLRSFAQAFDRQIEFTNKSIEEVLNA